MKKVSKFEQQRLDRGICAPGPRPSNAGRKPGCDPAEPVARMHRFQLEHCCRCHGLLLKSCLSHYLILGCMGKPPLSERNLIRMDNGAQARTMLAVARMDCQRSSHKSAVPGSTIRLPDCRQSSTGHEAIHSRDEHSYTAMRDVLCCFSSAFPTAMDPTINHSSGEQDVHN